MLQYVCDNSAEVRQAAAYGLGVMAQYGGDNYRPFCTGTDVYLVTYISSQASLLSLLHSLFHTPNIYLFLLYSLFLFQTLHLWHVGIYHPYFHRNGNEI